MGQFVLLSILLVVFVSVMICIVLIIDIDETKYAKNILHTTTTLLEWLSRWS